MARQPITSVILILAGLVAAVPLHAFAQDPVTPGATVPATPEIRWRTDYAAAVKEAHDRNLPLMVDIGTVNCYWCKKLDDSTLRDPRIIAVLNERFVPLKLDGEKEPALVQHLGIVSYPTMVLAAPDKRI